MRNPICLSTGCVYKLSNNRNDLIEELRKLSPSGIELSFAYSEYLLQFDISRDNLDYLRTLKFNSIHSPWENITYGRNKISGEVLNKISELYQQINARNVVFHKTQIDNYNVIVDNNFVASIENDDWRKPEHNVEDMKNILNKNKRFKFTLDFAHALSVSPLDIIKYADCFKSKLIEIHLSMMDKVLGKHDFLYKYDSQEIRSLCEPLKAFSIPVVLEAAISSTEEMGLLEKEMEYIKKL